ncbi:hypothetical protein [Lamprobacter sp.]|uniref:hypothetical protein n=1 Tax=Lamprobacter sp. TaxID=3100796 RepID=UPI003A4E21FA
MVCHFTPKHASWLNQIEMWFSILARKVIRRGNFVSVDDLHEGSVLKLCTDCLSRLIFEALIGCYAQIQNTTSTRNSQTLLTSSTTSWPIRFAGPIPISRSRLDWESGIRIFTAKH